MNPIAGLLNQLKNAPLRISEPLKKKMSTNQKSIRILPTFEKNGFPVRRVLSPCSEDYCEQFPDHFVVPKANIILPPLGKVWQGDLDLTRDGAALTEMAWEFRTNLWILHEDRARFGNEKRSMKALLADAVWWTRFSLGAMVEEDVDLFQGFGRLNPHMVAEKHVTKKSYELASIWGGESLFVEELNPEDRQLWADVYSRHGIPTEPIFSHESGVQRIVWFSTGEAAQFKDVVRIYRRYPEPVFTKNSSLKRLCVHFKRKLVAVIEPMHIWNPFTRWAAKVALEIFEPNSSQSFSIGRNQLLGLGDEATRIMAMHLATECESSSDSFKTRNN
jgi:hypothetical protein